MAKEYKKLLGTVDYDHEAAEELADALNEIEELNSRIAMLKGLVTENDELHQFVWRTADSKAIALHKIEDDHLGAIMLHLLRNQRIITKAIRSEAIKREMLIPQSINVWDDDEGEGTKAIGSF